MMYLKNKGASCVLLTRKKLFGILIYTEESE